MAPPTESVLSAARKQRGLSQEELASELDVTQPTISYWESGKAAPDPWDQAGLQRIAKAYRISVDALIRHFRGARAS